LTSPAGLYASRLLASLGIETRVEDDSDPVADWARSGAMALTGEEDGPPLVVPGPAAAVRGALLALHVLAPSVALPGICLLGERAALAGLGRRGAVSCGGASRLLRAADGWVALTLAREADLELVPALVGGAADDPWTAAAGWIAGTTTAEARARAALLGLPVGVVGEVGAVDPWLVLSTGATRARPVTAPLVVDLSALWAGPLCGSLMRLLGCRVVKVEDPRRPDGARRGPAPFFDLLNSGAESVSLDLASDEGRERLCALLAEADVVIEASRPRALAQLGIDAVEVVAAREGLTWVSITAYGREQGHRGGYGDDAAVAGGLVAGAGRPLFVGDAIADPLTGVHAALAAWAGVRAGTGALVDVSLSRVAAASAAACPDDGRRAIRADGAWCVEAAEGLVEVAPPRARTRTGRAPALGDAA
jgi:hypothetical protein